MRLPWWLHPYGTVRALREANGNQRGIILAQQAALEQLGQAPDNLDPPDWVIMGKRDDAGLMVLGSDKPAHAELSRKVAGFLHPPGQKRPLIPVYENTVLFTTPDLTVIRGRSYDECLGTLRSQWSRR